MLMTHALGKVEFVLEIARKDVKSFLPDLMADPYRAISQGGIDLTAAEMLAVVDVVKDTSFSPYAAQLQKLRRRWKEIVADSDVPERTIREAEMAAAV